MAAIQLARIDIGITPEQGKTGLLGLPTYLWVQNPGPKTLGPITDSATAGGITVTLTGKVDHVVWNMGDGTTVTCTGPGTPYQDSFGAAPSPTCGHMYKHPSTSLPGGAYPIRVTAVWDIAWTGGGQNGVIPFEVTLDRIGAHRRGAGAQLNDSWNGPSTTLRQVRTTRRDEVGVSSCSVVRAQMQLVVERSARGQRPPPLEQLPHGPLESSARVEPIAAA